MPELKSIQMGSNCFRNTDELKLIGLSQLERVMIEFNCFVKDYYNPNKDGMDPNRHFYLKNCPQLRELKIGRYSFSDYSSFQIENVPSLEVIEM